MKISLKQVYTSVACNRVPEIVDWNKEGLIVYGASNAVVIYDTNIKGQDPLTVLSHHHSKVNSVKWLYKVGGASSELVSCSADKTAAIWSLDNSVWRVTSSLSGHTDGVTCVYGVYVDHDLIVYTASIDSTVRIWKRKNGITTLKQTINLHSGLCLTLHTHILPSCNKPLLFCALDDHKVHIFAGDEEYHRVHTLIGHEDWVRGLDVVNVDESTILLASASQDTYIRLWKIALHKDELVSGIKVEEKAFEAYNVKWSVKLDAVLAGHEGWVYGVQWQKSCDEGGSTYRLLSSSLDKTLIIWQLSGVWAESVRVGEVGGNGLGFYGSRFGIDAILGHGYNGSLHIWKLDKESNQWLPSVVVGGHFSGVEDIRWEARGRFLVSVSLDQTTRIHAPWKRTDGFGVEWHEISRPQVHGYDMCAVALVPAPPTSSSLSPPPTLLSAADEKVLRVFTAPHNFVTNFANITGEIFESGGDDVGPEGASVPSLGLSNKAVFGGEDSADGDDNDGYFVPLELHEPPTEETLMQNTLWPETHKLYAHGCELRAADACAAPGPAPGPGPGPGPGPRPAPRPSGRAASAARASSHEHAAIVLWDTENWQQIQKLVSHTLTVTQLAFSPDGNFLLSVSRDRRWTLFQRDESSNSFALAATTDKTNGIHTRIIWCCAWAHDSSMFATGSRDGKVCVWSKSETKSDSSLKDYSLLGKPLEIKNSSVTALAFAPIDNVRLVAVGRECGRIGLYSFDLTWNLLHDMDNSAAHHLTVKRLFFKPRTEEDSKELLLASCGSDNFVRIHSLTVV